MNEQDEPALRPLVIDLDDLIVALNHRDEQGLTSWWLNAATGELRYFSEDLGDDETEDDPRDDGRFVAVEPIESHVAFRVMADFVDQVSDPRLARRLADALQKRRPFRGFKDVLADHPAQREAWFAFERVAHERLARQWCEGLGIAPTWRT
jgi:hypothetical protein